MNDNVAQSSSILPQVPLTWQEIFRDAEPPDSLRSVVSMYKTLVCYDKKHVAT